MRSDSVCNLVISGANKSAGRQLITSASPTASCFTFAFTADGAEGRLKANAAWATLDEAHARLYEQVREIFDPFGTLNPGVKQKTELRSLVATLRSTYDSASVL